MPLSTSVLLFRMSVTVWLLGGSLLLLSPSPAASSSSGDIYNPPLCSSVKYRHCWCTRHQHDDTVAVLSCINQNLTAVPSLELFPNLTQLVLEGNNIKRLRPSDLDPVRSRLRLINLNRNGLQTIENGTFSDMPRLNQIILSENNLEHVPNDLFRVDSDIVALDLSFNKLRKVPDGISFVKRYTTELRLDHNPLGNLDNNSFIGRLIEIKRLDLTDINMTALEPIRTGLSSGLTIEELYLDHNHFPELTNFTVGQLTNTIRILGMRHCGIQSIRRATFAKLFSLKTLHLDGNNLGTLRKGPFANLHLTELFLTGSNITSIKSSAFEGLITSILHMDNNNINVISGLDFEGRQSNPSPLTQYLEELYLTNCNITTLLDSPFDDLEKLFYLDLSDNSIDDSGVNTTFTSHPTLNTIYLNSNKLTRVPNLPSLNFPRFERLHVARNSITSLTREHLSGMSKLLELDIHDNPLKGFAEDDDTFAECPSITTLKFDHTQITRLPNISFMPDLTTFRAVDAQLTHLPENICENHYRFGVLNVVGNKIARVPRLNCEYMTQLHIGNNHLTSVPPDFLHSMQALRRFDISDNRISELHRDFFAYNYQLETITIGGNLFTSLPDLSPLQHLINLNASHNRITSIPRDTFKEQLKMDQLFLQNNLIGYIDPYAFPVRNDLKVLSLSYNAPLTSFPVPNNGFPLLEELYLEGNPKLLQVPNPLEIPWVNEVHFTYTYHCCIWDASDIVDIRRVNITRVDEDDDDFDGAVHTQPTHRPTPPSVLNACNLDDNTLDLIHKLSNSSGIYEVVIDPVTCKITIVIREGTDTNHQGETSNLLATINSRTDVQVTRRVVSDTVICSPPKNPLRPCHNLLDPWLLRIAIWAVWVLALLGNGVVLFIGIASRDKLDASDILVCALAIADILMGVYLAFLAIVDIRTFGNSFYQSALDWQLGAGCGAAGFLAVFSSELSIYLLVMLTLERVYTIFHSFNQNEKRRRRVTLGICIFGCVLAAVLAILPFFGVNSYQKVAVCLPFLTESFGDKFYIGFILSLNFVGFLVILFSYVYIFWVARKNAPAGNATQRRRDVFVASSKITAVIITAFVCWAPIAVIGYVALFDVHLVDASQALYFIVFVYPLNACINPFIYALATKRFLIKCCVLVRKSKDKVTSFPPNSHLRIQRTPSAFTSEYQMSRMSSPGSRHEELMKLRQSRRSSSLVVQMVDTSLHTPSPTSFKPPTGCNLGRRASLPPGFGSTLNMAGSGLGGEGGNGAGHHHLPHYGIPGFRLGSMYSTSDNSSLPNLQEESTEELASEAIFHGEVSGEQKSNPLMSSMESTRRLSIVEEENEGEMLGVDGGASTLAMASLGLGARREDEDDCFSESSSEEYSDACDSLEHLSGCAETGTDLDNLIAHIDRSATTAADTHHISPAKGRSSPLRGSNPRLQQTINLDRRMMNAVERDLVSRGTATTSGGYLSALELAGSERKSSLESSTGSGDTASSSLRHSKAYSSEDIYVMMMNLQPADFYSPLSNQANLVSAVGGGRKSSGKAGITRTSPRSFSPSPSPDQDQPINNSSPAHHKSNHNNTTSATASSLSPSHSVSPSNTPPTAMPSLHCEKSRIICHQMRQNSSQTSTNSNILLDSVETDV